MTIKRLRHAETITAEDVRAVSVEDLLGTKVTVSSPDHTQVPPDEKIVDAEGAVWTLSAQAAPGGQAVLKDGVQFHNGAAVRLAYVGGRVYCTSSSGAWWMADGSDGWVLAESPL